MAVVEYCLTKYHRVSRMDKNLDEEISMSMNSRKLIRYVFVD